VSIQWTATELTAKLQQFLEDDDLEFQGSIPDIINLGELRVLRDLDIGLFTQTATSPTVQGQGTLPKPAGYTGDYVLGLRSLSYVVANKTRFLELKTPDFIEDYVTDAEGLPRYYAEPDGTDWLIAPLPDAVYTVSARWDSRPTALAITTNESNWLSDNVGDLLFKACLAESEQFLKSDDRIAVWKTDYAELLPRVKRELYPLMNTRYPRVGAKPTLTPFGAD
jgi:hypothetical protein